MADGRFFSTTKRGEVAEYKADLNSLDRGKKKDAVKKVIAAMTVGKDVSSLFPDVVNCMQTDDMELKKLVYLYLINYAKAQPDLAIMAVNTFVKDSQDPNPLIRALAVRTMGCIRVDKIVEYLCDPLQRCLKDDDPYVRKTAAVCVAKLHDISPEMVEDRGFLDALRDMIGDANPMVVANAVAALQEIQETSWTPVFQLDPGSLFKLLRALNECTEWGQVFILDSIAGYTPTDAKDAEGIVERVAPRLQHANAAVVLSAVKVILGCMQHISDSALLSGLARKLAPPLVTLLGGEPEVQYVALRSIALVVQRHPGILANEVKVFFCKYNDPAYVKFEKLDIMVRLASEANIDQVLLEFREYATEVDVEFVRRAVRAIGRCAVAIEKAAERCINVLLELIHTRVNYVVQEAVVVIKDIFRRYPNRYESVIATLCENLESLDEPEAKAAMVWVVGEYAERIDNADDLLEQFLESFPEEPPVVQLALVTAAVKLFLKRPAEKPQQLIQLVLTYATQETDNPDLRDRAYIYWRLLSTDPEAAKDIVLAEKPTIAGDGSASLDPGLLDSLLHELGMLSSVYHRPAGSFVSRQRLAVARAEDLAGARVAATTDDGEAGVSPSHAGSLASAPPSVPGSARAAPSAAAVPDLLGDLLDLGDTAAPAAPAAASAGPTPTAAAAAAGAAAPNIMDLLGGLDLGPSPASPAGGAPAVLPADVFGGALAPTPASVPAPVPVPAAATAPAPALPLLLPADKGHGLAINGAVVRGPTGPALQLSLENGSPTPVEGFMIQLNKNAWGLAPATQAIPVGTVLAGTSASATVPLVQSPAMVGSSPSPGILQVAIKCSPLGVLYLAAALPLEALLSADGRIDSAQFVQTWKTIPEASEQQQGLPVAVTSVPAATAQLEARSLFVMAHKSVPGEEVLYVTGRAPLPTGPAQLLLELRFALGVAGVRAFYKGERPDLAPAAFEAVRAALA